MSPLHEGGMPSPALQPDLPVPHARPTLKRSTPRSKGWSWERQGGWKFTWNWPASVPGQQMFSLEPGWSSLQAVGGRRLQMISRVRFLVGCGKGLSLWGLSGLQDSSHHCLSPAVECVPGQQSWPLHPGPGSSLSLGLALREAVSGQSVFSPLPRSILPISNATAQ